MTTTTKAIIAAVLAVLIIGGVYYEVKLLTAPAQLASASPAGATFTTLKQAAVSFAPSTPGATSTSLLNSTGNDLYIATNFVYCENATSTFTPYTGTGLAANGWTIQGATTSTSGAPASQATLGLNFFMNDKIATGTNIAGGAPFSGGVIVLASSTLNASSSNQASAALTANYNNAGANGWQYVWPSGTYITFWSNATTTAQCTVGVTYFSS